MLIPLSPPPGLNSDDTTFSAAGRWADGNNVRFWNGRPQVIGGTESLGTLAGSLPITAILIFIRSGAIKAAYATRGGSPKLYVGSLDAPDDETPSGLGNTNDWALVPWGDTLLACPSGGTLYEQSGTSTATEVTQAPNQITWMLTTPERQVLACGCNEESSGTFNGLCIRGSDIEDYTDWTTAADNNAFEHILESSGSIVAARLIGQYVAVWTTSDLFIGQFIGDPGQAYRFDKVGENCGLAGPQAVVVHNQTAYWMGIDLCPRTWTPGDVPKQMPCPISKDFINNTSLTARGRIVASVNPRFNEIRFDYPDGRTSFPVTSGRNNRYIAVSLTDGSWHRGIGGFDALTNSPILSSTTTSYADVPTIIGARTTEILLHETGTLEWGSTNATGLLMAPYIQSADQYLDNSQRRMMIRSVLPDFEDQAGDILLTLFVRDRPQSPATTKGPHTLTTATTKKDFRASGKIVSAKFGGSATSLYFRMGKPMFDVVPMGER